MVNQRLYPTFQEQQQLAEAKKQYGLKDFSEDSNADVQPEAKTEAGTGTSK